MLHGQNTKLVLQIITYQKSLYNNFFWENVEFVFWANQTSAQGTSKLDYYYYYFSVK